MNLCLPCLHLISSSSFTNHRRCSYLTSPTPKNSHLPNPKHYFRVLLSASHSQRTTPTTSTTTTSTKKPVAVYLMERMGFSEEQSLSISKRILCLRGQSRANQVTDLISFENADNVITFLHQHCGFNHSHSHINKVITKCPRVLTADVDKTLRPKVKLLVDVGFTSSDLAHVLSVNPHLYLLCDLTPAIQALRGIMGSDDKAVVEVFKGFKYGSASNILSNLIPNVTILENEYGVPRDKIRKFMTKTPQSLLLRNAESLREVLVRMEDKWGIGRDSTGFLRAALHVFGSQSDENINSKCQVFRSYGWSESDIMSLIRKHPTCFTSSEAGMKKRLQFYMNELGYECAYMVSQYTLFSYSLENRVVPRYRVLSLLKEKGFIKATNRLASYLKMSKDRFFNKYILPYEEILPNLHDVYMNRRAFSEVPLLKEAYENES